MRVLPLGLQAGNRPVVNANDRPGIGHELIVPGAAQTAYRSARQRPHLDADSAGQWLRPGILAVRSDSFEDYRH